MQDGTYTPLSRPLFIYVNNAAYADKPQVKAFVDFTVEHSAEVAERAPVAPQNPHGGASSPPSGAYAVQLPSLIGPPRSAARWR